MAARVHYPQSALIGPKTAWYTSSTNKCTGYSKHKSAQCCCRYWQSIFFISELSSITVTY